VISGREEFLLEAAALSKRDGKLEAGEAGGRGRTARTQGAAARSGGTID
jgi:hypothetical protein